ncbi:unnamed protein product [Urochloa decumbens]|uniref:KIB1-4 beta-propeller domain-containing protein n=1 Tax=Urochloa decumbens TaxID=240449 RepID=A0ABC9CFA5_9POAL
MMYAHASHGYDKRHQFYVRESDIMQSPRKIRATSASTTAPAPAVHGPQGWADLPEGLLHSVVPLLSSFIELLSFASTCHSWRAAFASYPSKSTFCTLLPPLLVQPHISVCAPNLPSRSDDGHELRTCQVLDPANVKSTLRCQIPEEIFEKLDFAGSSYGQLICGHGRNCLVVDVFTGAKVLPPQLPFGGNAYFYSGMLSAPLASPNSHLLVCTVSKQDGQCFLLDWLIGNDCWSKLQLNNSLIEQIVEFNGQFIAIDYHNKLHNLSLAPQLGLQEIETVWWDGKDECPCLRPWIVVCSDMLLMVHNYVICKSNGVYVKFKVCRLDMSTVPAAWVEVKKLENYSLFIGTYCCEELGVFLRQLRTMEWEEQLHVLWGLRSTLGVA